jgi:hypothetical protein
VVHIASHPRVVALPDAFELETWDHPAFRVGSGRGKIFCKAAEDDSSIRLGDPYVPPSVATRVG